MLTGLNKKLVVGGSAFFGIAVVVNNLQALMMPGTGVSPSERRHFYQSLDHFHQAENPIAIVRSHKKSLESEKARLATNAF